MVKKAVKKGVMKEKSKGILSFFSVIAVIFILVMCSNIFYAKFDLTSDKKYTLTEQTTNLLENLDDVVQFKVYLDGDELPSGFVKLKKSINEILLEFVSESYNNIEFEFIDLYDIESKNKREKEIQRLQSIGIPNLSFGLKKDNGSSSNFHVTPGVEVFYKGKSVGANLLETSETNYDKNFKTSIENLEYQLSNAIRKLVRERAQNIGFLQKHGESGQMELKDLAQTLSEYYNIGPVFIENDGQFDLNALGLIDVLVVAGPKTSFNELELLIIDQFIMKGGRALFLLDGIHAEIDSLRFAPYFPALPFNSNLEKLLYSYGIRINNDLVEDQQCTKIPINTGPAGSQSRTELYPWVYFPLLFSENNHPTNINLDPIKVEFASTLDSIGATGITCTSLLKTSGQNRFVKTPTRIGFEDAVAGIKDEKYHSRKGSIAMLAEGEFTSYFKNRILPEGFLTHKKLITKSDSGRIAVISSGTFANNIILSDETTMPLGADRYNKSLFYDNKLFLLNLINYLSGDENLIAVRSKNIDLRLLNTKKVKNEKDKIKAINVVVPPLLILIGSLIFSFMRKRKYAKK